MNINPSISLIMPVYNAKSDELSLAIESILNQTFQDFEFIIINDGSTNNSEDMILSYDDERIKYLKNETNIKLIATLNKGLDVAKGKYIARLDSDDYSDKTRFEKQFDYLEQNPSIGVLGTYFNRIPENKTILVPTLTQDVNNYIRYCQNCIIHSSVMFRKSIIDKYDLSYDKNCLHAEDHKLWSDMSRYCDIAVYPEVLTYYRHSPDGISETNRSWQRKMVTVILLDNMINDYSSNKDYMYSILVKYVQGSPVSEEEFNAMRLLLNEIVNDLTQKISYPFNMKVKPFILSILAYFVRA